MVLSYSRQIFLRFFYGNAMAQLPARSLADDDMCNLFGFFIHKKDLLRIGQ